MKRSSMEVPQDYDSLIHLLELLHRTADPTGYCTVLRGNRKQKLGELLENVRAAQQRELSFEQCMRTVIMPAMGLPEHTYDALLNGDDSNFPFGLRDMLGFMGRMNDFPPKGADIGSPFDDMPFGGSPFGRGIPILVIPMIEASVVETIIAGDDNDQTPPDEATIAYYRKVARLKDEMPETNRMSLVVNARDLPPRDTDEEALKQWIRDHVTEPRTGNLSDMGIPGGMGDVLEQVLPLLLAGLPSRRMGGFPFSQRFDPAWIDAADVMGFEQFGLSEDDLPPHILRVMRAMQGHRTSLSDEEAGDDPARPFGDTAAPAADES